MKTAVSMPEPLFAAAEKLAKRLKLSRSALYTRAIEEYVRKNESDEVTARINQVLADAGDGADPFVAAAAVATLRRAEWDD